ncbi:MAG TPA: ABC transporter permease [Kiloniellales bacterium]|nr:ABC transporter permease [Kiloniellales bacterium]
MRALAAAQGLPGAAWLSRHAIWVVLLLLLAVAALVSTAFVQPAYLFNTVRQATPIGITALGVTLVMILGGVDLSVGAVISLAAVMCAIVMNGEPGAIPLAVALTLATGAGIGLLNGLLIAFNRVSPFILTLGMAIVIYGATLIYSGGTAKGAVSPGFREALNMRVLEVVPVLALILLALAALTAAVLRWTRFGRTLYLVGANREAAYLAGLPLRWVTVAAYTASGFFAALGGIALLARAGVSSTYAGRGYEFDVLAAVVLGGTTFAGGRGGAGGTLAGVFVLFVAFNLVNIAGLAIWAQLALKGFIIIAASAAYEGLRRRG